MIKDLFIKFILGLAMLVFVLAIVLLGAGCVVGIRFLLTFPWR